MRIVKKSLKKKWRTIYEIIDKDYIQNSNIFPIAFITKCKLYPNEPQFISQDVKNKIKRMAMEQSLYAQVIKFRRNDLKFDAADKNKNTSKFKFQGQSARSRYWFDIDLDWIEINFSTREPDFYKKLFQNHDNEQEADSFRIFEVPIGNAKVVKSFVFHKEAPTLIFHQKSLNSCCFSSLASAFASIKQIKAANAISLRRRRQT